MEVKLLVLVIIKNGHPSIEMTGIDIISIVIPNSVTGVTLHIQSGATGYDVEPWTNTDIFSSIVRF